MRELVIISELVEGNGKTIRENNLEISHKIPVGELIEIKGWLGGSQWSGIRLTVIKHTRDCDGTPLYSLGVEGEKFSQIHGFSEDSLRVL